MKLISDDEIEMDEIKQRDVPERAYLPPKTDILFEIKRSDSLEIAKKGLLIAKKTAERVIRRGEVCEKRYKFIIHKEIEKLKELREKLKGRIDFCINDGHYTVVVKVIVRNVETIIGVDENNLEKKSIHVFYIELPPDYPLRQPIIRFEHPIFHPNCSSDGKVDYEMLWKEGGKDLLKIVTNIIKIMTFEIVNIRNPINRRACEWYEQNKEKIKNIICNKIPWEDKVESEEV